MNFFSPEFLDGGNKIIYNLLKKNDEFKPDFLSLFMGDFSGNESSIFSHVKIDYVLNKKGSKFLKLLKLIYWVFLFKSRINLPSFYARKIASKIKEKHNHYDVIHLSSLTLATVLDHLPEQIKKKVVLAAIDSYSMFSERRIESEASFLKKILYKVEFSRGNHFEKKYYPLAKAVIFVSEVDALYTKKSFGHNDNIFHIPLGVDTEYFKKEKDSDISPPKIIFTGNLGYGPNKNACIFLARDLLPILKNKIPSIELILAGSNPPKELNQFRCNNLTITGFVDDLRPYIDSSHLFISPLLFGAGMKYKVLESFSMEKPSLCSHVSVDGIHCKDGEHCIIVPDQEPETWCTAIVNALGNLDSLRSMGGNARKLVLENYSWPAVRKQYRSIYENLSQNN